MSPPVRLRPEAPRDHDAIRDVTARAFAPMPFGEEADALIPERLRAAGALVHSTVAERDGVVVGHVALSPVEVGAAGGWLGLGPIAVAPDLQREGIGTLLMEDAIAHARDAGAAGLVLVGNPAYYGRFGFRSDPALTWRDVDAAYVMALPLGDAPARGEIAFHPAFG